MTTDTTSALLSERPRRLALEFRPDSLALFALHAVPEWRCEFVLPLAAADFDVQIHAMHQRGVDLTGDATPSVDIWLPAEQVLSTELSSRYPIYEAAGKRRAVADAVASRTSVPIGDLCVAETSIGRDGHAVAAVENAVVDEAVEYTRRWGFQAGRVTSRHAHAAFAKWPTFKEAGQTVRPIVAAVGGAAAMAVVIIIGALAFQSGPPPELSDTAPVFRADTVALTSVVPVGDDRSPKQHLADAPLVGDVTDAQPLLSPQRKDEGGSESAAATSSEDFRLLLTEVRMVERTVPSPIAAIGDSASMDAYLLTAVPDALRDLIIPDAIALIEDDLVAPANAIAQADDANPADIAAGEVLIDMAALSNSAALDRIMPQPVIAPARLTPQVSPSNDPVPERSAGQADANDPRVALAPEQALPEVPNATDTASSASIPGAMAAPREKPQDVKLPPSKLAAKRAPQPRARPDELDLTPSALALTKAPPPQRRPRTIKPKATTIVASTPRETGAKTVSAPSRAGPSGPGVANAATLKEVIRFERMNLLGVFGSKEKRRALLRMPDGQVMRVTTGSVVDGWVVSRITATSMRITRSGTAETLNIVR